jgi:hypothetical protein
MITVNQYKKLLQSVLESHPQVKTVLFGNEFDFNSKSDLVYPVANIAFISPETIRGDKKIHQFSITIADSYDTDIEGNDIEIVSDCSLIADDIITYFENQIDGEYEILSDIKVTSFKDGNVDRIAGCVFGLNFTQFRESNIYKIPKEPEALKAKGFPYSFPISFANKNGVKYGFPYKFPIKLN